jgi:hypothetical protein
LTLFDGFLLFLGEDSLVFAEATVVEVDETLGYLEEVLIGLIWCKINLEIKRRIRFNFLDLRLDSERVLNPLLCGWIENIKQGPVNLD